MRHSVFDCFCYNKLMILIISPKKAYVTKRLKQEAKNLRVKIKILDVPDLVKNRFRIDPAKYSCLFVRSAYVNGSPQYLPKVIELAKIFRKAGKRVVDKNIVGGNLGKGKWHSYCLLKKNRILIPKTNLVKTKKLTFLRSRPYIIKWIYGMKAQQTFFIKRQKDFKNIPAYLSPKELLKQEFISADYEYKVFAAGYRALPVILRFSFDKKRAGINFWNYKVLKSRQIGNNPLLVRIVKLAEKSCQVLGRELAKVDVLQRGKKLYVLEVNRTPGFEFWEKLTGLNMANYFIRYLQKLR